MNGRLLNPARREWAVVLGTWFAGALVFYREVWMSGFNRLSGDVGDPRLIAVLHEHWLKVFTGHASWRTPNFFHPVNDTLGYSDTFALDAVLFAPMRILGFDELVSLQLRTMLLGLIGFIGMYIVGRRIIGAALPVTLVCAWLVVFANNLYIQNTHPQLFSVGWVPWCIVLGWRSVTSPTPRRALAWAMACGVLAGMLLFSTYYIGWFMVLAALIVGGLFLVQRREPFTMRTVDLARRGGAFVAGFALPMIPFAFTYLPKLDETGGRNLKNITLPDPRDLISHGKGNIWSSAIVSIAGNPNHGGIENAMALTPVFLMTVIACGVVLRMRAPRDRSPLVVLARALVASALVLTVLPIKIGEVSLWRGVWQVVPGARALRAVDRLQVITGVVAALALVVTSVVARRNASDQRPRRVGTRLAFAVLAFLLLGEQLNSDNQTRIKRHDAMRLVTDVPQPPESCESFIIAPDSGSRVSTVIDAMWIAQDLELPTLNGYSGNYPPGWNVHPTDEQYLQRAAAWAERNGLQNVCMYDPIERTWSTDPLDGIATG